MRTLPPALRTFPAHQAGGARRGQRGAALVIGLVLLLVLTLLAVSSMNSASLEFVMAGNEQYRANAFQTAELGIEQSLLQGSFNPDAGAQALKGANANGDAWNSAITLPVGNVPQPALWGNCWNCFSTYHFEIVSTGSSVRGANAVNRQGVAYFAPASPTVQPDPLAADTSFK